MILSNCHLHMELPEVHSLKGRRAVLNRLKEKLKKFNISLLDISGEYAREADVAFVFISHDARKAAQYREEIESMLERYFSEYFYELECEEV
ncbi:MAG: DUF503 family protein [Sulfurimonas sp.]